MSEPWTPPAGSVIDTGETWTPSPEDVVKEEAWTPPPEAVVEEKPSLTQVKTPPVEAEGVEPETTLTGMTGAVTRGLAPTAAQVLAGAGVGLAVGGPPGALVGAAAGPLLGQLSDLTVEGINSYFGTHYSTTEDAVTHLLDKIQVAQPRSSAEKITKAVSQGAAELAGGAKGFQALAKVAAPSEVVTPTQQVTKQFLESMGQAPKMQAAIGGTASGASEIARQSGAGPAGQILTGIGASFAVPASLAAAGKLRGLFPPSAAMKEKAGAELVEKAFEKLIPDKEKAMLDLEKASQVTDEFVKPTSAQIIGQDPILALESSISKISPELANRRMQNIAGLTESTATALKPTGASPEEAKQFISNLLGSLEQGTTAQIDAATKLKDTRSANLMQNALNKANAIKEKADAGKINADEALQQIKDAYQGLFTDLSSLKESTAKDTLSNIVFNSIEKQKNREKIHINDLYAKAEPEVPPFYQTNTIASKEGLVKEFGEERRLPAEVQKILSEIVDQKGNPKLRNLNQLRADIKAINAEISSAQRSPQRASEVPALIRFKQALNADIDALEGVSQNLKKANRAYYEYATKYKDGASGEVFKPDALTSKTINEYIGRSEAQASPEEISRLRSAILGKGDLPLNPAQRADAITDQERGVSAVNDWVLGKMSTEVAGKKTAPGARTSQDIENWIQSNGQRIFDNFPETRHARSRIYQIKDQFKNLENGIAEAKANVKKAAIEQKTQGENASKVEQEAQEKIKIIDDFYKDEVTKLKTNLAAEIDPNSNPAARFINGNPEEVVRKIMGNKETSEDNVRSLVRLVSQDKTGAAREGLKNSFKKWMNSQIKPPSEAVPKTGLADPVATADTFQVNFGNISDMMKQGSATRNALEIVFGKDSAELAALDKARQQIEMTQRASTMRPQEIIKEEQRMSETMDTLLQIAAISVSGMKGFVAGKGVDLIKKVRKKYKDDILIQFKTLLEDALLNPEVAYEYTRKITKENTPQQVELLKRYGINLDQKDLDGLLELGKSIEQSWRGTQVYDEEKAPQTAQ